MENATPIFRIFVIEDNRTEGILLQLALSEIENITVSTFSSATAMLKKLDENPDIAIIDLNLPDMNGLDLIRQIRQYNEKIRMVVISAQKDMDILAEVQAEGVYNYLVKSEASLTYLHQVIEDLLIIIEYRNTHKRIEK